MKGMDDAVTNALQLVLMVTELGCIAYAVAGGVNVGRGHLQHLTQMMVGEKDGLPPIRMKRGFWMILAGVLLCLCALYVAHGQTLDAILYGIFGILCQDRASKAKADIRQRLKRQEGRRISPNANSNRQRSPSKRRRRFS